MTSPRSRRVLVVDDDVDVRDSVKMLLEVRGYEVFATGTQIEAKHLAQKERVHVAVLDVRLESNPDQDDISGLLLAKQLDPVIVKIMLSNYHNPTAIHLSSFGETHIANFVFKQDSPDVLVDALSKAFEEEVQANFELIIDWEGITLEDMAYNLEVDKRVPLQVVQAEIEETLCKLFHNADRITVSPLVVMQQMHSASQSQSGAIVLKVQPHYPGGWAVPVVVKLAAREKIEVEAKNYKQYVRGFIDGFRHTLLQEQTRSHLLGGIVYTLIGTPLEHCVDLNRYYLENSAEDIIKALQDLFQKTCHHWYQNKISHDTGDLVEYYSVPLKITVDKLKNAVESADLTNLDITLRQDLNYNLVDPVAWFEKHPTMYGNVTQAWTHGDLHSRNVLIDQNQQAWLIDFYRSGPGHYFRDLIELESDIKFSLLSVADLRNLLYFEAALLNAKSFQEAQPSPRFRNPELQKAFDVIRGIRVITGELFGPSSMQEYYQGLLLQTLAILHLKHISKPKKRHAYLSAALICRRLDTW